MPQPSDKKGNGIITEELTPRWQLVQKKVEVRELDPEFDSEISSRASSFADQCRAEGKPAPDPESVADRIRHVLRHSQGKERVVLLSQPRPPYFGVTTKPDPNVEQRRVEE